MLTLRPPQMAHFRQTQLASFAYAVADEVRELRLPGCHHDMDADAVRAFAWEQALTAQRFGLDGEFMVKGFVLCAWYHGVSFYEQPLFAEPLGNRAIPILKELFLTWGYLYEAADGG